MATSKAAAPKKRQPLPRPTRPSAAAPASKEQTIKLKRRAVYHSGKEKIEFPAGSLVTEADVDASVFAHWLTIHGTPAQQVAAKKAAAVKQSNGIRRVAIGETTDVNEGELNEGAPALPQYNSSEKIKGLTPIDSDNTDDDTPKRSSVIRDSPATMISSEPVSNFTNKR